MWTVWYQTKHLSYAPVFKAEMVASASQIREAELRKQTKRLHIMCLWSGQMVQQQTKKELIITMEDAEEQSVSAGLT